jgi:cytochrome c553
MRRIDPNEFRLLMLCGLFAGAFLSVAPGQSNTRTPVERGKYLVETAGCHDCHTPYKNGQPDMTRILMGHPQEIKISAPAKLPSPWNMAGSETNTAWTGPWGVSFSTNLTPDRNTGIGLWTEQMFIDTIRKGKHGGTGRDILPPMPWTGYAKLTDADLKAIFAYLKSIPAITNRVPQPLPPAKQ